MPTPELLQLNPDLAALEKEAWASLPQISYLPSTGRWTAEWHYPIMSPAQYLSAAQRLVDSIDETPQAYAGEKRRIGLYFQTIDDLISGPKAVDMERFEPLSDWDEGKIRMAQFTFQNASFTWERGRLTLSSHCNLPRQFAEFICQNTDGQINEGSLAEMLEEVGVLAQERHRELATQQA